MCDAMVKRDGAMKKSMLATDEEVLHDCSI
jgi:hypothetical protein